MSRKDQLSIIKNARNSFIEELEGFYKNAFEEIANLKINERDITKLTQTLLQSKDGAIQPLTKEIEKQVITKSPNK